MPIVRPPIEAYKPKGCFCVPLESTCGRMRECVEWIDKIEADNAALLSKIEMLEADKGSMSIDMGVYHARLIDITNENTELRAEIEQLKATKGVA